MLSDTHKVNTKNKNHILCDPCLKSKIGRLSVKQKGVQLWNKLGKSLTNQKTQKHLRKK